MAAKAGLDHRRVVQAAADLADRVGIQQVSLALLADEMGVRSPTLYHYVDGLAGLHRELALLGTQELGRQLGRAVMGRSGDEAVVALGEAYRTFVKAHPGLYAATVEAAAPGDSELSAAQGEVLEIALRAISGYHLEGDDAIHMVRILRSAVHGFSTLEVSGAFGISLDLDESFYRLLQTCIAGLRRRTSERVT
jgi:AcrR family transcriptional regulator